MLHYIISPIINIQYDRPVGRRVINIAEYDPTLHNHVTSIQISYYLNFTSTEIAFVFIYLLCYH